MYTGKKNCSLNLKGGPWGPDFRAFWYNSESLRYILVSENVNEVLYVAFCSEIFFYRETA